MKMSGTELIKEEGVNEVISEVSTSNNTIAKVAVAGVVIAAGVAVVLYVRKRRSSKANNETSEVEVSSKKSEK